MKAEDILALIIEMTPAGPQHRALDAVLAELLRYKTVAKKARLLALGVKSPAAYVMKMQWADDILHLTMELDERASAQLEQS